MLFEQVLGHYSRMDWEPESEWGYWSFKCWSKAGVTDKKHDFKSSRFESRNKDHQGRNQSLIENFIGSDSSREKDEWYKEV